MDLFDLRTSYNNATSEIIPGYFESADEASFTYVPHKGELIQVQKDQLWFWTEEWQAGESRVEEYIREGNVQTFDTPEEFLESLQE